MHLKVCLQSVVLCTGVLAAEPVFVTPRWISVLGKDRELTLSQDREGEEMGKTPIQRSDLTLDKL